MYFRKDNIGYKKYNFAGVISLSIPKSWQFREQYDGEGSVSVPITDSDNNVMVMLSVSEDNPPLEEVLKKEGAVTKNTETKNISYITYPSYSIASKKFTSTNYTTYSAKEDKSSQYQMDSYLDLEINNSVDEVVRKHILDSVKWERVRIY